MGVSIVMGVPQQLDGLQGKNPMKMDDDQGYPHFTKPPYIYIWIDEDTENQVPLNLLLDLIYLIPSYKCPFGCNYSMQQLLLRQTHSLVGYFNPSVCGSSSSHFDSSQSKYPHDRDHQILVGMKHRSYIPMKYPHEMLPICINAS